MRKGVKGMRKGINGRLEWSKRKLRGKGYNRKGEDSEKEERAMTEVNEDEELNFFRFRSVKSQSISAFTMSLI